MMEMPEVIFNPSRGICPESDILHYTGGRDPSATSGAQNFEVVYGHLCLP
jgi:hypothetical protein